MQMYGVWPGTGNEGFIQRRHGGRHLVYHNLIVSSWTFSVMLYINIIGNIVCRFILPFSTDSIHNHHRNLCTFTYIIIMTSSLMLQCMHLSFLSVDKRISGDIVIATASACLSVCRRNMFTLCVQVFFSLSMAATAIKPVQYHQSMVHYCISFAIDLLLPHLVVLQKNYYIVCWPFVGGDTLSRSYRYLYMDIVY